MRRWFILTLFILIAPLSYAQIRPVATTAPREQPQSYIRASRLGITFINSVGTGANDDRYRNALSLGAGWNRWPLYWQQVEHSPGQFNWGAYDRLVMDDVRHGLRTNAILLERPSFYQDGASISGLQQPVFADGTDIAGPGKPLNPNNPWAMFVFNAVNRYMPGGELARSQGWSTGVRVWEIWNEPDLPQFWQGGIVNYARMLKVAYIAAHQADPNAVVMVGGLLFNTPTNWLDRILAIYVNDPLRSRYNWYMDAVAIHSYQYPWRTGHLTEVTVDTLASYGLTRPIYVNETGLSVWNDYPGPVWSTSAQQRPKLGTLDQQAWFVIQNTAYAWVNGADVVFFHQLYDDCGDQPAGTDFPPHNGELCGAGLCSGDGWGLFRNPRGSVCFSQHPSPGSPRPAAAAYLIMAQVFGSAPFTAGTVTRTDGITMITFRRNSTNELIRVIWNRRFEPNTAIIPASSAGASLYRIGRNSTIAPQDGNYRIELGPALSDNYPRAELENTDISAIGGEPVILVELGGDINSIVQGQAGTTTGATSVPPTGGVVVPPVEPTRITPIPSSEDLLPTPGPVLVVPVEPTVIPEEDTEPPVTFVEALPPVSPTTFTVRWWAEDNGIVERYVVWVQVNDEVWSPWLETTRTEASYTGASGNLYRFAVWAVDAAGNWSTNTNLVPQAETVVN